MGADHVCTSPCCCVRLSTKDGPSQAHVEDCGSWSTQSTQRQTRVTGLATAPSGSTDQTVPDRARLGYRCLFPLINPLFGADRVPLGSLQFPHSTRSSVDGAWTSELQATRRHVPPLALSFQGSRGVPRYQPRSTGTSKYSGTGGPLDQL